MDRKIICTLNIEENEQYSNELNIPLIMFNVFVYKRIIRYRYVKFNGIKFKNCDNDLKILSLKLLLNDYAIINLSEAELQFFKFINIETKQGNDKYFDFSILNLTKYIFDGIANINLEVIISGKYENVYINTNECFSRYMLDNTFNDFNILSKQIRNSEIFKLKIGSNTCLNGLIISGINNNLIDSIYISYNGLNFRKYITYNNTLSNYIKTKFKKIYKYKILGDNTIYIPLQKGIKWNDDSKYGKTIKEGNIYIKFELNNLYLLTEDIHNIQIAVFLYNYLVAQLTPKYSHIYQLI